MYGWYGTRISDEEVENVPAPELTEQQRQGLIGAANDAKRRREQAGRVAPPIPMTRRTHKDERTLIAERVVYYLPMVQTPFEVDVLAAEAERVGMKEQVLDHIKRADRRVKARIEMGVVMKKGSDQRWINDIGVYRTLYAHEYREVMPK